MQKRDEIMNVNVNIAEVLEALERAKANVPKDWEYLSEDEEIMDQVFEMEYMLQPLSAHLGVSKELFPPANQLEDDEIKIVVDKILEVWAIYHYFADLPEGLPIRIAYKTLLSVWDETVGCCPIGNFHFCFSEELEEYFDFDL